MTAVAVVSAAQARLAYFLSDRVDIQDQSWKKEVELLKSKLQNVEDHLNSGSIDRDLENKALRLAYGIEDSIENFAFMEKKHHRGSTTSTNIRIKLIMKSLFTYISLPKSHKLDDNQTLLRKIDKLIILLEAAISANPTVSTWNAANSIRNILLLNNLRDAIVSVIDEDFEKLQRHLLNNDEKAVITIVGVNGIGKTTLAKKLFDDPSLVTHFDCRAWVTIGKEFQARDIIAIVLLNLPWSFTTKKEIDNMETTQLMERLYKEQRGRKCLVVLEDVWSEEAWDTIQFAFPSDHHIKFLITTRESEVGKYVKGFIHQMDFLNEEKSWELFKFQAGTPDLDSSEDKETAKEIVRHCKGLPLAITTIGSMLRGREREDWNEVLQRLGKVKHNESILPLSYDELPLKLKPCFLYLGLFPLDQVISVEKLCLLWMGEGLISISDAERTKRMQKAENYLLALVQRGLVLVEKDGFSAHTRNKSCKLHELIHNLCINIRKKEGFFGDFDAKREKMSPLMRRMAIHIGENNTSFNISDPRQIRALLFFDTGKSAWPKEYSDLKEFELTRILDFDGVHFESGKFPKGIEKLLYLRYLSFRGCYLEELPSTLTNFHFLETLDLCISSCKVIINANILNNMTNLRNLYFPEEFENATDHKLRLNSVTKLEILVNFHASLCDVKDLPMLKNLEILEGTVDGDNEDFKKMIDFIQGNNGLSHSSLTVRSYDSYSVERQENVASSFKCDFLYHLHIEGYLGSLPTHEWFGSNFTKIVLDGSEFNEDPMFTLGKLPNLTKLVLCNEAYNGNKMCTKAETFPKLKFLELVNLRTLKTWEVESQAMPFLSSLTVERCNKLKELPSNLMHITTLEEVKIGPMLKEFLEHVRKLIEGKNVLRVTFYV